MARPNRAEELSHWRQRIRNAEAFQRADGRLQRYAEIREYYLNRRPKAGIGINLIFAIGRALVPQVYFKAPAISARPSAGRLSDPAARLKAKIIEAVDAQLIEQNLLKSQYKLGILDAFRFNLFILKHGYSSIGSELPDTSKGDQPEDLSQHPAITEMLMEMGGGEGTEDELEIDSNLKKYSYHDLIVPNSPWALRVPPEDFLVPWGTRNIYEAPWCAFKIRRPLDDVKADPVYNKAVTSTLKANWGVGINNSQLHLPFGSGRITYPTQFKNELFYDEGWLEFYEVWTKRGEVLALTLEEGENFMRKDKHHLPISLPVSMMQFNDDGEDFWSVSDAEVMLPLVKELNETRTIELNSKKISLIKMLVDRNLISENERNKMLTGEIGPMVLTDGPPANAVAFVQAPLNRDLFNIGEETRRDIRETVGFSRNSMAEFEAGRRSATEANIVNQNLALRGDERRDQMADFISRSFGGKINPMIFEFWKNPKVIEVTGYKGGVTFVGSALKDKYTLTIAADSTLPVSKEIGRQEAEKIFNLFRGDPKVNQDQLYRYFFDHMESAPTDLLLMPPDQAARIQMALLGMATGAPLGPAPGAVEPNPVMEMLQAGPGGGMF